MLETQIQKTEPYQFDPRRRLLIKTALTFGSLSLAGIPLETGMDITSSVFAQVQCPTLPTDGNPAECTTVGEHSLEAASKFSGYYYIDNGNNVYDEHDLDVMGVPNRRILVETLQPIGSSDYVQPYLQQPASRTLINGRIHYYDAKNNVLRPVQNAIVLTVPSDGGIGLALDSLGNSILRWRLTPGNTVDKIWGPVHPQVRASKLLNSCGLNTECGWNCVQWVVVSRLTAAADLDSKNLTQLPNEYIHQLNGKVSAFIDFIHYWDLSTQQVIVDHSFINSPVEKGSALWKKENLTQKYVERPPYIRAYN